MHKLGLDVGAADMGPFKNNVFLLLIYEHEKHLLQVQYEFTRNKEGDQLGNWGGCEEGT